MKQFYLFFTILFSGLCSHAQIKYTDVSPVRVLDGSTSSNKLDSVKMHLAYPLTATIGIDSALHIWHFNATAPASKDVGVDCRGSYVELLQLSSSPTPTQPAAIDSGVMINASAGTWTVPKYKRLAIQGASDNWDSKTDKYLGVRFMRNAKWYYGWIKMSIDATPTKCEIKGYAYESIAETGIIAGNKGTSSSTAVTTLTNSKPAISTYNKTIIFHQIQHVYDVQVIDLNGQTVHRTTIDENRSSLYLPYTTQGLYVVKMQSGKEMIVQKIML